MIEQEKPLYKSQFAVIPDEKRREIHPQNEYWLGSVGETAYKNNCRRYAYKVENNSQLEHAYSFISIMCTENDQIIGLFFIGYDYKEKLDRFDEALHEGFYKEHLLRYPNVTEISVRKFEEVWR